MGMSRLAIVTSALLFAATGALATSECSWGGRGRGFIVLSGGIILSFVIQPERRSGTSLACVQAKPAQFVGRISTGIA